MTSAAIPDIVISRLPVYLRALTRMLGDGQEVTSSKDLGEHLGISSAQIRKDLSHFGEFGKQGTGYQIRFLVDQLRRILKVEKEWDVALVGAGAIGHALAHYNGFRDRGFRISMIFDKDPSKIGTLINGFEVQNVSRLSDVIPQRGITLAMLAVPAEAAQAVANELIKAGVRGILSYAPINISVPEGIHVQQIDPVVHLQRITYYV
ncbi:MAG: redox-sensing transcriptional repressor Rex [Anaerolineales bacterium]|nr:redox-sensing transcriptional repressor Rex [Anaerolineales bacterium]